MSELKTIDLIALQTFLNKNEIPKIKSKPKTFLSIAKQPHYENVISNLYAFYFDVNEVHNLKDLFIKSLIELINVSNFDEFSGFWIDTEYGTSSQKRIDILLQNDDTAIIIENKIYHHLNNDLSEYYNEIKVDHKIGVVLSLHHISNISHKHFVNITHLQLLNKVMNNLGNYVFNANEKYMVFLKDFYQNIINLSHPFMERESIAFYFKNQQEINQLTKFKFQLREHIISEVVKAGQIIEDINVLQPRANSFNDKRLVYYVSPKNRNLMITVVYEKLLNTDRTMYIAVELQGELLNDRTTYNTIDFNEKELEVAFSKHFNTTSENWSHFAVKHYVPNETEVASLSEFIIKKLEDDHLLSIFKKLEQFIKR